MKRFGLSMYQDITQEMKNASEAMLDAFFAKNNIELSKDKDIVEICKSLGFKVLSLAMDEDFPEFDGVMLAEGEKKIIGINSTIDIKNARFVIAHELAHYIFNEMIDQHKDVFSADHKQKVVAAKDKVLHKSEKPIREHLMDYMAANILVPKKDFLTELNNLNVDVTAAAKDPSILSESIIDYLSHVFNVNEEVIRRRIKEVA